jgi:hypothetical protein
MSAHLAVNSLMLALILLASCARNIFPASTYKGDCIRANTMRLNRASRILFDTVLSRQLDSRRRKYNGKDFCAYYELTTNRKYALVTVFDQVGNHMSPTWVLLSDRQAVDTRLDKFEMATDSLRTIKKIAASVDELLEADPASKQELVKFMTKDARFYVKR